MKKFTFIFFALLSFTIYGQDVTFNFNAGDENWEASGFDDFAASAGNITTGVTSDPTVGGFAQIRSDAGLNLTYNNYKIVRFVIENSTNVTLWQVINYDTGSNNAGASEKENFDIPTVTAGSGFTTFDVPIPANGDNAGIIDRIGIRARQGNPFAWTGELKIAQVVIINTTLEDTFVANPGFETSTDWTASGGEATGSFTTTDPQAGAQAGQLAFTVDQTSTQTFDNTLFDFGVTVNPLEINATFWFKAPRTDIEVQILYDLYAADGTTKISSNNTGTYSVTTPNTWEQVSLSKTITDEFNQIQFRLKVKQGALNGDVVSFDDVTANFSYFQTSNSWTGADSDWTNTANWTNGVVPVANKNADIQLSGNNPVISSTTGATLNNLVVDSSASLSITAGGSLIVNGTSTGNVTYNRTLNFIAGNTEGWHLVASPLAGQVYNDAYATANSLATSATRRGLANYLTGSDSWSYLENDDSNAGTFASGTGYSLKRASTGTVSFTGTINTSDAGVNAPVLIGGTGGFNLLGVPYTSYINSATFLTDNTGNLVSETIWLWNPTTKNYETKVTVDGFILAPGQGFFARASSATNLNFAEINQTGNADTFQKSSKTEIKILMNDGESDRFTKIYYLPNATKGFDNGYDGETFGGQPNTTDIFTQLLAENVGKKYQVQSIPNSDYEEMIIPVGITADAGKEITFTADAQNLPSGINVYLEDRQLNTFTRLDEANANYKVTLADASNGTGRFYMHTASKALSTDSEILTSVSIYKTNNSNLRVAGLQNGNASVKIFNILGKQVLQQSFTANGPKDISLPTLVSGIYIVQLQNEAGSLSKKIILE